MRRAALVLLCLVAAAPSAHAFDLETVPGSYEQPLDAIGPPGDPRRLFVVGRAGLSEVDD